MHCELTSIHQLLNFLYSCKHHPGFLSTLLCTVVRSLLCLRNEQRLVNFGQKLAIPAASNGNHIETKRGNALRGWQLQQVRWFRQVAQEKTHAPARSRCRQRTNTGHLRVDKDNRRKTSEKLGSKVCRELLQGCTSLSGKTARI